MEGVLDRLLDISGETTPLVCCSTCSHPEVADGRLSGSGDEAADDRREDERDEAGRGILDPGGWLVCVVKTSATYFSLLLLQLILASWVK